MLNIKYICNENVVNGSKKARLPFESSVIRRHLHFFELFLSSLNALIEPGLIRFSAFSEDVMHVQALKMFTELTKMTGQF